MAITLSLTSYTCSLLVHCRLSHQGPSDFQGNPFPTAPRFNHKILLATRIYFLCSLNNFRIEAISLSNCYCQNPMQQTYFLVVLSWVLHSLCDRASLMDYPMCRGLVSRPECQPLSIVSQSLPLIGRKVHFSCSCEVFCVMCYECAERNFNWQN